MALDLTPINEFIRLHPARVLLSGAVSVITGTLAVATFAFKLLLDKQKLVVEGFKAQVEDLKIQSETKQTAAAANLKAEQDAHAFTKQQHSMELSLLNASHEQELEKAKDKYERRAQRIDRIVKEDFLDVSKLQPIDIAEGDDQRFFPDDFFWAHDDPAVWEYEQTTFLKVYHDWFGDNFERIPIIKQKMDQSAEALQSSIHLWRGKEQFAVEEHAFVKRMYPFVIVARSDRVLQANVDAPTKVLFDFLGWLDVFERADVKTTFKVTKMQSASEVLYLRGYFTFRDVRIGGKPNKHKQYYLLREVIFVPTSDSLYTITTGIPNERLAIALPYLSHITTWLNDFRPKRT
jgi:hypothetical protein